MAARTLKVKLTTDLRELGRGLSSAGRQIKTWASGMTRTGLTAMRSLGRGMVSGARSLIRIGGRLGKWFIGGFLGAIAAGLGIGYWLTKMASNAEEVRSKFSVVFKHLTTDAEAFVQSVRRQYGLATTDIRNMMAEFQDTLVPLGLARKDALKLSEGLSQLALDLASFNPRITDASEAADMLRSILTGSHEVAKNFGVAINDATLKQELFTLGLGNSVQKATEAQKVLARYSLMVKGTSDAQGDLARTADSWKNTWNRLKATFQEFFERIGSLVLPVMRSLSKLLDAVVSKLDQALAGELPDFTTTIERIVGHIDALTAKVQAVTFASWGEAAKEVFSILWGGLKDLMKWLSGQFMAIADRFCDRIGFGLGRGVVNLGRLLGLPVAPIITPRLTVQTARGNEIATTGNAQGLTVRRPQATPGNIEGSMTPWQRQVFGGMPTMPLQGLVPWQSVLQQTAWLPLSRGAGAGGNIVEEIAANIRKDTNLDRLATVAAKAFESTRTPLEEFRATVADLQEVFARRGELLEKGLVTPAAVSPEAIWRAGQQAARAIGLGETYGALPTPGAKLAGTREAYTAILQHQLGRGQERLPQLARQQLDTLRNILASLKEANAKEATVEEIHVP